MDNIKAFIFDMDGTLLDSETICDKTWEMAFQYFNLSDDNDTINKCRGTNKTDTILILKQYFGQNFDAEKFFSKTSEYFHKIEFEQGIPLMPYAKETLKYLKEKNYRIALASSTRYESVKRQLTNAGLIDFFETITTGDMVKNSKPNPEIFSLAVKSLNLKPEECIAIEDTPNGIKSAYGAGLIPIMIPDKVQPTDQIKAMCYKIFPSLKQFVDFLNV